jgi:Na+-transporting NADH:ubiquinone oxidoreductase subunit NqrF
MNICVVVSRSHVEDELEQKNRDTLIQFWCTIRKRKCYVSELYHIQWEMSTVIFV